MAQQQQQQPQMPAMQQQLQQQRRVSEQFGDDDPDASFHEYMASEDGQDELNDEAYQESARALAKSTGWDQAQIEGKANDAVKSLTSAIGGRKVVSALKGMLNGLSEA